MVATCINGKFEYRDTSAVCMFMASASKLTKALVNCITGVVAKPRPVTVARYSPDVKPLPVIDIVVGAEIYASTCEAKPLPITLTDSLAAATEDNTVENPLPVTTVAPKIRGEVVNPCPVTAALLAAM